MINVSNRQRDSTAVYSFRSVACEIGGIILNAHQNIKATFRIGQWRPSQLIPISLKSEDMAKFV